MNKVVLMEIFVLIEFMYKPLFFILLEDIYKTALGPKWFPQRLITSKIQKIKGWYLGGYFVICLGFLACLFFNYEITI